MMRQIFSFKLCHILCYKTKKNTLLVVGIYKIIAHFHRR